MGRYRGAPASAEEDPSHRTKRRRVVSSGENLETTPTGTSDGKRALYHCNYCNKDISGKIRIKCTKCPDFDLCVECFSVGAEVTPHKSNHPYRVMDNLSFPLIYPDWNADEEILLLEGIEMYGLGNWAEVAEHVGTKSKAQCIDHYTTAYMNSPCYPLPDMSHVVGKNRKELLAMAKVHGEGKKGFSVLGEITPKEESPFSPSRVKFEDLSKEGPAARSPSSLTADGDSGESKISGVGCNSTNAASTVAGKKASTMLQFKDGTDGIKIQGLTSIEDSQADRTVGGKKPKYSGDEGPPMTELSGYNPKRQEFDPEYDNDAEQPLAEMEFKDNDTETDRELKLRVLHIYLSRLDERKRRKDFILERNLLYSNPLEKELSNEDREIYQRYKVFMRFHSQEEHDALVQSLILERKIRQRIQELQEYRTAGCRTISEGEKYAAEKKKRESESNLRKAKDSGHLVSSGRRGEIPVGSREVESKGSGRIAENLQMAPSQRTKVTRNKDLVRGIGRFSRSKMYHKRGLWAIKQKNGGTFPCHDSAPPLPKPAEKPPKFYPAYDTPKPLKNNRKPKPAKLRASITPGTVLIILAGRFMGKRVVFLKQLSSGLLLVTGPFKVNGVPLRRVNQAYVIATSTKVDISGVDSEKFSDKYFAKEAVKKKKKGEGEFFEEKEETKALPQEKKDDQKDVDVPLIKTIEAVPDLKSYLASRFSLRSGMKPHELVF